MMQSLRLRDVLEQKWSCLGRNAPKEKSMVIAPRLSVRFNKDVAACVVLGAIAIYAIVAVLG